MLFLHILIAKRRSARKLLCQSVGICLIMWHSHLNDMEIPETKRVIPKGFELGTTLS